MAEPEWGSFELAEIFPDPVHKYVSLATFTVDADSDFSREFMLEPRPFLAKSLELVDESWTVSLQRINAEVALHGPKKNVVIVVLLGLLRMAHVLVYRLPQDAG
jgi:hypothetical protein